MLISVHKPNDSTYLIRPSHPAPLVDHIGKGIYNVSYDRLSGTVTLDKVKSEFRLPAKICGDAIKQNADIVWNTFRRKQKEDCLGAIMVGLPGTGKSLTAEIICNKALFVDMPVFTFTTDVPTEVLYMLAGITPAAVFYFDEFSRLGFSRPEYGPSRRGGAVDADLLTFFSDSSLKGHLFILTDNTLDMYPQAFVNRPGRFLFRINYDSLSIEEFQTLMVELDLPEQIRSTLLTNHIATPYTYDILLRVQEEISRLSSLSEQLGMLRIMNIPRTPVGELMVCFEASNNPQDGFHGMHIPFQAVKVSDKEATVTYVNAKQEQKSIKLHLLDNKTVELDDVPGVRQIGVHWRNGLRKVTVGGTLVVRNLDNSNAEGPYQNNGMYSQIQGSH